MSVTKNSVSFKCTLRTLWTIFWKFCWKTNTHSKARMMWTRCWISSSKALLRSGCGGESLRKCMIHKTHKSLKIDSYNRLSIGRIITVPIQVIFMAIITLAQNRSLMLRFKSSWYRIRSTQKKCLEMRSWALWGNKIKASCSILTFKSWSLISNCKSMKNSFKTLQICLKMSMTWNKES